MATQTVRSPAVNGTDSFQLTEIADDTLVATAAAARVSGDLYTADFTDVPAGTYRLYTRVGSFPCISDSITLLLADGIYYPASQQGSQIVQYLGEVSVEIGDRLGSVGWPADPFVIGDAYTAANGRALQLTIKDAAGNVLTGLGDQSFGADAEFRFDPTTAIDTADFKASLTWVPAAGEEPAHYLWELTAAESAKALPLIEYTGQLILFPTTDGGIHKTTVLSRCFEFDAEIN